jgi:hypothetical protein
MDIDSACWSNLAGLESTTFKLHKEWYWYNGGSYYTPISGRRFQYGIFKDSYIIFDAGGFDSDCNAPPTRCDMSYISKVKSSQKTYAKILEQQILTLPVAYKQNLHMEWRGWGHF